MDARVNYLDQGVSHPSEGWKYCKSPQRLAGLLGSLENIVGRTPPFVHPMATTSLFAQSMVQQLVSWSSIRSIGSTFTGRGLSCAKNKESEGVPLTINRTLGAWRLEVSWVRDSKHRERPILKGSSK